MAIYKPTYCYPYGGNIDFCVDPDTKAIYLQCKINTSNKKVTGYRLILADNEGNTVWEPKYISPIEDLALTDYGNRKEDDHGVGFNGDTLIIPLVQNWKAIDSVQGNFYLNPNCLYADIDGTVDYYITSSSTSYDDIKNLTELQDWNNTFDNSYKIGIGDLVVKKYGNANVWGTFLMTSSGLTAEGVPSQYALSSSNKKFYVKNGVDNHNTVWSFSDESAQKISGWLSYLDTWTPDTANLKTLNLVEGTQYSWKIILYQGDERNWRASSEIESFTLDGVSYTPPLSPEAHVSYVDYCDYSDTYDVSQYDILIAQGQILGSNGERLQIYPADVILQNYYVQLGHAEVDSNGVVTSWRSFSDRANIQIYDSSYGHIYPIDGAFEETVLQNNPEINACVVYKHSNNPAENLESDMVRVATTGKEDTIEISDILYHLMDGGLMSIDNTELREGDLILLKDLTGFEFLNGVYSVHSGTTRWNRNGSYTSWSQFIGKILLIKEGSQNTGHNFQSKATAGGILSRICGTGINAITPIGVAAVFYTTDDPTQPSSWTNGFNKSSYSVSLGQWEMMSVLPETSTQVEADYEGKVICVTNEDFSNNPNPITSFILYRIVQGTPIRLSNINIGDVIYIKEMLNYSDSNNTVFTGGFVCFTSASSGGSTTYTWYNNSFPAGVQDGSNLYFIPEQPVVLYPKHENLDFNFNNDNVDYVNVGEQISDSNSDVFQYNLNIISGSVSIASPTGNAVIGTYEPFLVDGAYLNQGEYFLGIYHFIETSPSYNNTVEVSYVSLEPGKTGSVALTSLVNNNNVYTIDQDVLVYRGISSYSSNNPLICLEYSNQNTWSIAKYWYLGQHGGYEYIGRETTALLPGTKVVVANNNPTYGATPQKIDDAVFGSGGMQKVTITNENYNMGKFYVEEFVGSNYKLRFYSLTRSNTGEDYLPTNYIFSVTKGKAYGGEKVSLVGTSKYKSPIVQIDISSVTALLNINSANKTFIKPCQNIQPGQYMVFTEVDEPSRRIVSFDNKNYGVELYNNTTNTTIYSSITNSATKEPYKYQIMSYFKESDYNPVNYNGDGEIGFAYVYNGDYQYYSMSALDTPEIQSFILDNSLYNVTIKQQITFSGDNSENLLRGYYKQGFGKRWEYYRMAIFNENGILLQDTGNIYDGDFSQYFWGLQPTINNENPITRYCLLIVEDEFGKIYTTGIKLISPKNTTKATATAVSIKYNYNLQSIDLEFAGLNYNNQCYTLFRQEIGTNKEPEIVDQLSAGSIIWKVRDYNITNNRKYKYYINEDNTLTAAKDVSASLQKPLEFISTLGKCWSIAELYPADLPEKMSKSLTIKKKYTIDENKVWLFKYNGEFGSQTQNIAKSEQATLGKYPRIGQGMRNSETGSVSCLLGSEIISGKRQEGSNELKGYQERLRSARELSGTTTSGNNAIDMLKAWREFVQSKNPKLLKDVKGQSWIVQIVSNQNTPMAHVQGQPDTISFSWTQIGDTDNIIITGNIDRDLTTDH